MTEDAKVRAAAGRMTARLATAKAERWRNMLTGNGCGVERYGWRDGRAVYLDVRVRSRTMRKLGESASSARTTTPNSSPSFPIIRISTSTLSTLPLAFINHLDHRSISQSIYLCLCVPNLGQNLIAMLSKKRRS